MSEACFTSEVYALYAIGSLDGEELRDLESHKGRGCDICRVEIGQSRQFWSTYAAAVPVLEPPAGLKRKILAAVAREPLRAVAGPMRSWWMQAVAAALLLGAGIAVGWRIHPTPPPPAVAVVPAVVPSAPTSTPDELRNLQARIDQLNASLADREKQLQALAAKPPSIASGPDLQPTVDALRAENAERGRLVQEAQDRATQLASEIQRLRDQANAAVQTAADERRQAQDRESRMRADYSARIRQLENESEKLQRVIDTQQRRLDQNAQLVSFFSSPSLRFYQYKGTNKGPAATAHVILNEGSRAMFYAFHMPQLGPGRTYQLWLIRGHSPAIVSGGLFRVDAQGNAVVEFANPALTRDIRQFAVTDEPAAGSAGPTGSQFFRAS